MSSNLLSASAAPPLWALRRAGRPEVRRPAQGFRSHLPPALAVFCGGCRVRRLWGLSGSTPGGPPAAIHQVVASPVGAGMSGPRSGRRRWADCRPSLGGPVADPSGLPPLLSSQLAKLAPESGTTWNARARYRPPGARTRRDPIDQLNLSIDLPRPAIPRSSLPAGAVLRLRRGCLEDRPPCTARPCRRPRTTRHSPRRLADSLSVRGRT